MESYRGMRSPAFDQLLYTDKGDYRALRWVMEKGIDLRGFRLEMEGEKGSGVILARLMGWRDQDEDDYEDDDEDEDERQWKLAIAEYYVTRGKLRDVDEAVGAARGTTALHVASKRGYAGIVKGLLAAGADVGKANDDGYTPLHEASERGHTQVVRALISAGADVDKTRDGGFTPLHAASKQGHVEVVRALISAEADWSKRSTDGSTALDLATSHGHQEVIPLLEQAAHKKE